VSAHLRVIRPGPRTTVQDLGRYGWGHIGVPMAGAVDQPRHRRANQLVGNPQDAATLEITLGGLVIEPDEAVQVAVSGVEPRVKVNGAEVAVDVPLTLAAADKLEVATPSTGLYTYLSVAGGIDVEPVLGSRSTDTLSGIGPAVLSGGALLPIGRAVDTGEAHGSVAPDGAGRPGDAVPVHAGPHLDSVGRHAFDAFASTVWRVAATSDRTAVRLEGDAISADVGDMASEGLFPGAVQLPPDGVPIVFLANHPATGGYPVIAVVALSHLATLAQTRPGGVVRVTDAGGI
jgi:biotin-dependent carboxylase-like uncharacterized protein